jgi:hypothetical protein
MKIGVLSYHSVSNFGAQLQVLSTVSYLKKAGYTPVVINWYAEDLEQMYKKTVSYAQFDMHSDFVLKYLPVTALCRNEMDVISRVIEEEIDGIIIGSDAILNYQTFLSRINFGKSGIRIDKKFSNRSYPNPFWGNFTADLKKKIRMVMMSASAQDSVYTQIHTPLQSKMCCSLLNFKYVSVRDSWTQKMIECLTKKQIIPNITPDPVFGFNHNVAELIPTKEEILRKYNLPFQYILLSFKNYKSGVVSEEWLTNFEKAAEKAGCASVALCMPEGIGFKNNLKYKIDTPLCPLDWYALIKYSQGYIGHNMHPIVVSLHNANPFFSFDNYGIVKYKYYVNTESSKIYHILKEAGLLKYRCSALGRLQYQEPSYEMVLDCILHFDRDTSKKFSNKYLARYLNMMKEIENVF